MTQPDAPGSHAPPHFRPSLVATLLLVVAAVAAYANAIPAAFVLDDRPQIVENPYVVGERPWSDGLRATRPLVALSLRWNYDTNFALGLDGLDPRPFHAFNVAVHLVAGLALFRLVATTLTRLADASRLRQHALGIGFAAALLWLVHPLGTQAVTYVTQRGEAMMAAFFLVALLALRRSADEAGVTARGWATAAGACGLLSMASKEVAVVLPAVALLYDRAFLAGSFAGALKQRWPVYLLLGAGVVWLVVGAIATVVDERSTAGFLVAERSWLPYALTQPLVILHYLRLAVWPAPLVFDYEWSPATGAAAMVGGVLGVVAVLLVTSLALPRPRLGFLPAAFLLVLAPTSSVLPIVDLAVEHRMYLPLAAVVTGAVCGVAWLLAGWSPRAVSTVGGAAVAVIAIALGVTTYDRNRDYRTEEALWRDTVTKRPENVRAHHNLANVLFEQNRLPEALDAYGRALELEPQHAQARVNYAVALARAGRRDDARRQLEEVLAHLPNYAPALNQLGVFTAQAGDLTAAEGLFTRAIGADASLADAHAHLGNVMLAQGRSASAAESYMNAITLGYENAAIHNALGMARAQMGQYPEALHHFAAAVALDPGMLDAQANLARVQELLHTDAAEEHSTPLKPERAE